MRILMFVPQYPFPVVGGLEKQAHVLGKALLARGLHVSVVSGKVLIDQPDEEDVEGINVSRISWSKYKLIRFMRSPFDLAIALWRHRDCDVVHVHQHSWVGIYVIAFAKLLNKPVLTKLPNVGELGLPGLSRRWFGWLRRVILLHSDAIVAMSAESVAELNSAGYSEERVFQTPNGIALDGVEAKRAVANEQDICRVVFLGRLSDEKQLDILLTAWAIVSAKVQGCAKLEIWGGGPLEQTLKCQCARLDLCDSVRFAGHVREADAKLASMDVFVLPSRAEGNSNAILEAMAAGLPIVSTPVGGTPMLVGKEGRNWLFPVGDVEALSGLLLKLIADKHCRLALGKAMQHRTREYFDIQRVADSYVSVYEFLRAGEASRVHEASNPVVREQV